MLTEITAWLRKRDCASLAELARQFNTELSAMEGMLEFLERNGRVQRLETKCSRCKGCCEVKREDVLLFQAVPPARPVGETPTT